MARSIRTLAFLALVMTSLGVRAQEPTRVASADVSPPVSSSIAPLETTPEMWFYQQSMRLYEDPKVAVRRKAEFAAAQRQQRLATQKWYGISNARPTVNATPWGSLYSPTWTASASRPYGWIPSGRTVYVTSDGDSSRR